MGLHQWDAGTGIVEHEGDLTPSVGAGHALSPHSHVTRIGPLVFVHLADTWQAGAADLAVTIPPEYRPAEVTTDESGNWSVHVDGTVHYLGSKVAGGSSVLDLSYLAGETAPS